MAKSKPTGDSPQRKSSIKKPSLRNLPPTFKKKPINFMMSPPDEEITSRTVDLTKANSSAMPSSVPQSITITATGQIISNGERSVSPSEVVASKNFSDGSNKTPLSNPMYRNPQIGAMQTLDHLDNLDNLIE